MTGVGSRSAHAPDGEAHRDWGVVPSPVSRFLTLVFVIALLTLPIFAHGCHTGDHDDEPVFVPQAHDPESPR
jgi:hypothetical protein